MSKLNEHLWSGIIHRSETGEERKEDSVDSLDLRGLLDYIDENYESPWYCSIFKKRDGNCYAIVKINGHIGSGRIFQSIEFHEYDNFCEILVDRESGGRRSLYNYLQKRGYDVKLHMRETMGIVYLIKCNDIKTNKQFLKLLDGVIEWNEQNPKYSLGLDHIRKKIKGEK